MTKYGLGFKFRWGFSIAEIDNISISKERVRYGGFDNLGSRWGAEEHEIDAAIISKPHPKLNTSVCECCERLKQMDAYKRLTGGYYCPEHGRSK